MTMRADDPLSAVGQGGPARLAGVCCVAAKRTRGLRPTLWCWRRGVLILAAERREKPLAPDVFRHHDVYQVLAYCTVMNVEQGLLVYPAHEALVQVEVGIQNIGVRIRQATVDQSGDAVALRLACDRLAQQIFNLGLDLRNSSRQTCLACTIAPDQ